MKSLLTRWLTCAVVLAALSFSSSPAGAAETFGSLKLRVVAWRTQIFKNSFVSPVNPSDLQWVAGCDLLPGAVVEPYLGDLRETASTYAFKLSWDWDCFRNTWGLPAYRQQGGWFYVSKRDVEVIPSDNWPQPEPPQPEPPQPPAPPFPPAPPYDPGLQPIPARGVVFSQNVCIGRNDFVRASPQRFDVRAMPGCCFYAGSQLWTSGGVTQMSSGDFAFRLPSDLSCFSQDPAGWFFLQNYRVNGGWFYVPVYAARLF